MKKFSRLRRNAGIARSSRNPPTAVINAMINTPEPWATKRNTWSGMRLPAERVAAGITGCPDEPEGLADPDDVVGNGSATLDTSPRVRHGGY
ncbi:hypothetical protein MTER_05480 [Mycolicibacter terrae]|uniref:Uncharacterized protein n=1 Tax=Mycolicibacter terrae TaxID=1788 RepID=A0AAD1HTE4_9MYCO|nr:hypothetical protein MTER_05480 [Mycolicibacter terrae]